MHNMHASENVRGIFAECDTTELEIVKPRRCDTAMGTLAFCIFFCSANGPNVSSPIGVRAKLTVVCSDSECVCVACRTAMD